MVEKITAGEYKLKCDTPGSEGNGQYGSLIPVDYIAGLETAELTDLLVPGDDEEDVEALRERYFRSLTSQAYGGNIADYEEKCMSIPGVGDVKVAPVWNGGGTVKLTIIDSTFSVPSSTFVDEVQEIIDPEQNAGKGYGVAPIGHVVTVVGVKPKTVNIETTITYADGWSWEAAKTSIQEAVDGYFKEQAKAWKETKPNLIVRISQIESRILDCEGVLDISGTTLNGNASNLSLAVDEIPVRGTINGN